MRQISKNWLNLVLVLVIALGFSGCYETQYYHQNNHHTKGWYEHRHRTPPAGVNFEIDIHK